MLSKSWWYSALAVATLGVPCNAQRSSGDPGCATKLSEDRKNVLLRYVRQKYGMLDSIALAVKADSLVKDTCYRQIVFEGTSDVRTWDLTLYSSPDERFLASDLLDMSLDPIEENRQKNQQLMCALSANKGASKGSDH